MSIIGNSYSLDIIVHFNRLMDKRPKLTVDRLVATNRLQKAVNFVSPIYL